MRRIQLPSAGGVGWSYDPSSIDEVIEARLRRQDAEEQRQRELVRGEASKASLKRGILGLNASELDTIRHEATRNFFNGATLSEDLRQERQKYREHFSERTERFLKGPQRASSDVAKVLAVMFATHCENAIMRATGEFADLLTQATITRRGRKDFSLEFRAEIWRECLRFAMDLARWENVSFWLGLAWGHDQRETALPHIYRLESMAEQRAAIDEYLDQFRPQFVERIRHASPKWLEETERRISLRCLLSGALRRRANLADPSKLAVAMLLCNNPELTAEQVCAKLDLRNEGDLKRPIAPILPSWRKSGAKSWIEAFSKFPGRVKTYISSVKKEAGKKHKAAMF